MFAKRLPENLKDRSCKRSATWAYGWLDGMAAHCKSVCVSMLWSQEHICTRLSNQMGR